TGGTADRNRSHWSTSKTPSYTKSVSWQHHRLFHQELRRLPCLNETDEHEENTVKPSIHAASASLLGELLINILNCDRVQIHTHKKTSSLALERFLADLITINYEAQKK
ncbi:hypothetical protein Q7I53_24185, partial [Escherichia coli]